MGEVKCFYCGERFFRLMKRIYEAEQHGWKQFCSSKCQYQSRIKAKLFKCGNSECKKTFFRTPHEIPNSGICFCSNKCSAKINNTKRNKNRILTSNGLYYKKNKICMYCHKQFIGINKRKYCSYDCASKIIKPPKPIIKITKEQIIKEIRDFYKKNNRIPMKIEYFRAILARRRFGSWNNAIISAGYKPNPVMFAEKHIANDGHKCDSLAEKIIDDWLFERHIKHKTKVPYHKNRMTADFQIGETYIEFFGLRGQHKKYDRLVQEKQQLWKEKKLNVISIYPEDLFPKNHLDRIIKY